MINKILKTLGLPVLALAGAMMFVGAPKADARVHVRVYPYSYPYYDPYYYPYGYGYDYPYYGGGFFGFVGGFHDPCHFVRGFRGGCTGHAFRVGGGCHC